MLSPAGATAMSDGLAIDLWGLTQDCAGPHREAAGMLMAAHGAGRQCGLTSPCRSRALVELTRSATI